MFSSFHDDINSHMHVVTCLSLARRTMADVKTVAVTMTQRGATTHLLVTVPVST
jgi:hypothetical protein